MNGKWWVHAGTCHRSYSAHLHTINRFTLPSTGCRRAVLSGIDHKTGTTYGVLSLSFRAYAANAGYIPSLLGSSFRRTCVILRISHGPDALACACAHSNGAIGRMIERQRRSKDPSKVQPYRSNDLLAVSWSVVRVMLYTFGKVESNLGGSAWPTRVGICTKFVIPKK
jgi:hypothetical protein